MRNCIFFSLIGLCLSAITMAQIPNNYYNSITNQTGYALKTQLRNIIANGHTARTYDQLYDGQGIAGTNGYIDTHSDTNVTGGANYENDGTVLDMYSENPNGADPYNFSHNVQNTGNQSSEGDCYNREHLVPQSSFNSAFPMQSDIHHVIPSDCRVNNFRGSFVFGNVSSASWTSMNGSKRGPSGMPGYTGTVFEPIDEFKGDIARALLYFATRYENSVNNYTSFDMFNGTNDQVFHQWAIDVLLDWHFNVDPVDDRERARNHAAYNFQGNANPFVDHPQYANLIWNPNPDTTPPSIPTNVTASNPTSSTIDVSWTASTDNVAVDSYDIYESGNFVLNTNQTNATVTNLNASTNYCFTVKARDASGNESALSTPPACETTTNIPPPPSGGIDLFFSEYIEGSGLNKALEIANTTGNSVNLSSYSVRKDVNGGGTWDAGVTLTGSLANGEVFVMVNSGIDASCAPNAVIDFNTSNTPMNYNGNDPIGLFKNGTLIDMIGTTGGASFAAEVTLVRKDNINGPTSTYDANQWNTEARNDCSDLGTHTTLDTDEVVKRSSKIYPNPVKNSLQLALEKEANLVFYSTTGKVVKTLKFQAGNHSINVSDLPKGLYFVRINSGKQHSIHKLIKE